MSTRRILITGANTGLGFSTCCRLIDEFLSTRQLQEKLHLIFTTRDKRKHDDTVLRLESHISQTTTSVYGEDEKTEAIRKVQLKRVKLEGEIVDLCDLSSVRDLSRRLLDRNLHLDAFILNAGIGGWTGMNWPRAIWSMTTNTIEAVTTPDFKIGQIGRTIKRQSPEKDISPGNEPPLGEIFTANVFGHYLLAHWLAPLLTSPATGSPSRVIWVSSIEAVASVFDPADLQALTTDKSYESSKRLTDVLALTSELPSTQPSVTKFLPTSDASSIRPKMYVSHPGICATNIGNESSLLYFLKLLVLHFVRLLGSPWHTIDSYIGAVATVWLALADDETLREIEGEDGKGKWGAATDRSGNERVVRTEVEGWGWSGKVGEEGDKTWRLGLRQRRGKVLGKEEKEDFEVLGGQVWKEMEELRVEWEKRLGL